MKKINYFYINDFKYPLAIGLIDQRICFIGFEGDKIENYFSDEKYLINFKKENPPKWVNDLINDFFYKNEIKINLDFLYLNGTDFQIKVWKKILSIKKGNTITYSDLANELNLPNSTRAVATAVAKNPILLLIPCHRVISKNVKNIKFRSGVKIKKWLLSNEKNN